LGHDLETEEKNSLKYFCLNTVPAQGKKVQVFPSFCREWFSQQERQTSVACQN